MSRRGLWFWRGSSGVKCPSHHISRACALNMSYKLKVDLHPLAKVPVVRFLHCQVSPPWILDCLDGKQQAEPNSRTGMHQCVKAWNLQKLARLLLHRSLASSPHGRENHATPSSRDPCPAPQNLRRWYDAWQEGFKFADAIRDDNHLPLT